MSYTVLPATLADLPDLTKIMQSALSSDAFWTALKGTTTLEAEYKLIEATIRPRLDGSSPEKLTWKVVDEHG
jgi:hypothetical protein